VRSVRVAASILLLVALVIGTAKTSAQFAGYPSSGPCTPSALSRAMTGDLRVSDVANLGCEGPWAFLWATVGPSAHAVSVTEVLHYDPVERRWRLVSRSTFCHPTILPPYVYRQGCFSN